MCKSLTITEEQSNWTKQQLTALNHLGVQGAQPADLAVFLHQCQRTGLDPFNHQIYMIGRRQKQDGQWIVKQTIQVGIDGFRTIARRAADRNHEPFSEPETLWCGEDGVWHDVWIAPTPPVAAKVTVRRGEAEFTGVALYREYVGTRFDKTTQRQVPNSMWASKPATMIAKCAEALALRKAFPQDLSGLYSTDEMQQANNKSEDEIVEAEVVDEQPRQKPRQYAPQVRQGQPEQAASQAPSNGPASPDQLKTVTDILRACQIKPEETDAFIRKILHDQTVTSVSLTAVQAQTFINEYHKHMQQQGAAQ